MEEAEIGVALATNLDLHFEQLALAYQTRLYAFARRLGHLAPDAEEIVQDTLIRAYRALATYPTERITTLAIRPWLYQIALNVARNRARRRQLATTPLASDDPAAPARDVADDGAERPETAALRAEQRQMLADLVAALPPRYRVAVVLRHIEGMSYPEVAVALDQPLGTVKANVHRGVKLLRTALEQAAPTAAGASGAPANAIPESLLTSTRRASSLNPLIGGTHGHANHRADPAPRAAARTAPVGR